MTRHSSSTFRSGLKACGYGVKELEAYEETIHALNKLQTNASTIRQAILKGDTSPNQFHNIQLTEKYLKRCGIDIAEFERRIGVIHVSGTKGKGTTCALCESCLREYGYKTGLFTSPHLIHVSERIKINGNPLPPDQFVKHFWSVYNVLENNKDNEGDMPSYFKFLTVMAFSVFLKEDVDVAIVEVGIGGELDCTNVLRNTPVVGITSLDLDHTSILGKTIESIAWQKAGIIKPGSRAFTVSGHTSSALEVLQTRAIEKKSKLIVVPSLEQYQMDTSTMSPVIKLNASLAVQLTHAFINWKNGIENGLPLLDKLDQRTYNGLLGCCWPGRCQVLSIRSTTFYLDGAHTAQSASISSDWFDSTAPRDKKRALLFNCTGGRDPSLMLEHLAKCNFSLAIFTTNSISSKGSPCDMVRVGANKDEMMNTCEVNRQVWDQLLKDKKIELPCQSFIADSVLKAFEIFHSHDVGEECHMLVTGSLHLVGSALSVLSDHSIDQVNGH